MSLEGLVVVSARDLSNLIVKAIKDTFPLDTLLNVNQKEAEPYEEILTRQEAARLLKVQTSTIANWEKADRLNLKKSVVEGITKNQQFYKLEQINMAGWKTPKVGNNNNKLLAIACKHPARSRNQGRVIKAPKSEVFSPSLVCKNTKLTAIDKILVKIEGFSHANN